MFSRASIAFLIGLVAYTSSQEQPAQGEDLGSLINKVFPKPTDPNQNDGPQQPNLQPNNGGGGGGGGGIPGTGSCTCVPYYLCNNGSVNTNGEGIIDIRIEGNNNPCSNYLFTCCGKEDVTDRAITPPPPPEKRQGCGFRNPDGLGFRITGGQDNEAEFGEFPWMVAILREPKPGEEMLYHCGGALIHPEIVLTAAHCCSNKDKKMVIRAGEWDTQTTSEVFPYQEREVVKVVRHPNYHAGALFNDIALLFLKSPVDVGNNVGIACLPEKDIVVKEGVKCFATGWGKDIFGKKGKYQVILKKIDLPVVPNPKCQEALRTTRLGTAFKLDESFICAGGVPEKDTCKGDGGSPLVCPIEGEDERYIQAGIVSWGVECGKAGLPGVYANVPKLRSWIDEQVAANNLEIENWPSE